MTYVSNKKIFDNGLITAKIATGAFKNIAEEDLVEKAEDLLFENYDDAKVKLISGTEHKIDYYTDVDLDPETEDRCIKSFERRLRPEILEVLKNNL